MITLQLWLRKVTDQDSYGVQFAPMSTKPHLLEVIGEEFKLTDYTAKGASIWIGSRFNCYYPPTSFALK